MVIELVLDSGLCYASKNLKVLLSKIGNTNTRISTMVNHELMSRHKA